MQIHTWTQADVRVWKKNRETKKSSKESQALRQRNKRVDAFDVFGGKRKYSSTRSQKPVDLLKSRSEQEQVALLNKIKGIKQPLIQNTQ